MWSHYSVDQYDKRINIFSSLSGDLDAYTVCQNELTKTSIQSDGFTDLKIQCAKYGIDINRDLFGVNACFVLDDQTHQKYQRLSIGKI